MSNIIYPIHPNPNIESNRFMLLFRDNEKIIIVYNYIPARDCWFLWNVDGIDKCFDCLTFNCKIMFV